MPSISERGIIPPEYHEAAKDQGGDGRVYYPPDIEDEELNSYTDMELAKWFVGGDSGAVGGRIIADTIPLDQIQHDWNNVANIYVDDYRLNPYSANALIETPAVINTLNGALEDATVADLCTGTGYLIHKIFGAQPSVRKAVGVDISPAMLNKGASLISRQPQYKDRVLLIQSVAESTPLPPNYFDVVTNMYGMDNVSNLRKAIHEIRRILKPGGLFVGLIKNPRRNELYALAGTGSYFPGYNSFYREKWKGTGGATVLARYMTVSDWQREFFNSGLVSVIEPIDLSRNQFLFNSVAHSPNPNIKAMAQRYIRVPSGAIITARKP